jgi:hypothetical protein
VWARYLARRLAKEGYQSKVGHLPDDWRDNHGKADWDGALRTLVARSGATGANDTEVWEKCQGKIRTLFLQVLKDALQVEDIARSGLYAREDEQAISWHLRKVSYEPKLPCGGAEEERIAARLFRLGGKLKNDEERLPAAGWKFLLFLAGKHGELQGRYYIRKPLKDKTQDSWKGYRAQARARDDVEVERAAEIALKGVPEFVSDFYVEPLFVLEKIDGTRQRAVRIHNVHGKVSAVLYWPAEAFSSPKPLREWLANSCACATWSAGERELNFLQYDIGEALANKEVKDAPLRGFDEGSNLCLFGDVAITPEGKRIFPDKQGLYWHQGQGYRPAERDQEGQEFRQGIPRMHPEVECSEEDLRELFQTISQNYFEAVGDYGGYIIIGNLLSYGLAPEIFRRYSAFPSLWLDGASGSGKSSLARWSLRFWGFSCPEGIALPGSTQVGISCVLQQYGNLAVWLEEYQPRCEPWVTEKLKGIYDRMGGVKKTFGELTRVIRTGVIVTGVATSSDSQLRSRYCHVHVAKENRINDTQERYQWFQQTSLSKFFLLGRYVLEHRTEFARLVMDQMHLWMEATGLADCEDRSKIVHGTSYCAFAALAGMLQSHPAEAVRRFRDFVAGQVEKAAGEVREKQYVSQFWTELVAAGKANELGFTAAERRRYLKVLPNLHVPCPVSEHQRQLGEQNSALNWESKLLFVTRDVVDRVNAYKKKVGSDEPSLKAGDLRAQIKDKPYHVPAKSKGGHQQRFEGGREYCYCIDLDKHELGLQQVSDEEFDDTLRKSDGTFFPTTDWEDPRKGPLFQLVDSLKTQT